MKSKHILPIIILTTSFTLAACGHEHQFSDATCTEPKICVECQETEGEPLGHDFSEPTCETPATCTSCGLQEGNTLEHEWEEANYDDPKTCKTCGLTEGEPLPTEQQVENTQQSSGVAFTSNLDAVKNNLDRLLSKGMITQAEYDEMWQEQVDLNKLADENGNVSTEVVNNYNAEQNNSQDNSSSGTQYTEKLPDYAVTKTSGEGDSTDNSGLAGYYDPDLAGIRSN